MWHGHKILYPGGYNHFSLNLSSAQHVAGVQSPERQTDSD